MDKNSIPLEVVYSRVESSGVPLTSYQDFSSSPESVVTEKPKKKKAHCCVRFFTCLWTLFLVFALFTTIGGMFYSYYQWKGCFHSKHYDLTQLYAVSSNVKEINFDIVTGGVIVGTHEKSEITVNLYRSARDSDLLDGIEDSAELRDGVLSIKATAPAFDFESCQFSYVEILFPEDFYVSGESIKMTGNVHAGFVELGFLSGLGEVSLSVGVGAVEIEGIGATSLEVQTGLGYITASGVYTSEYSKFAVEAGTIGTKYVMTPEYEARVKYGNTWTRDVTTDSASVSSKFGYSALLRPSHLNVNTDQTLAVDTFYGKSIATYDQYYGVEFSVAGESGTLGVIYDDECTVDDNESTENHLKGECSSPIEDLEPETLVHISSTYGKAVFIQLEPTEDTLSLYPEMTPGMNEYSAQIEE